MKRGVWFLAGAVAAGLLAALLAVRTVRSFNETDQVLVATRELAPYSQLTRDDFKAAEVPQITVPADAIRDTEQVVGKYLQDRILAGEVLRLARLTNTVADRVLAAKLTNLGSPALRAFALPYDPQSAVGGRIRPGDRVDIIASVKIDAGQSYAVGVGKIVAQAVEVLEATDAGGAAGGTIVLALAPEQIEDIAFALTSGKLRFALNPYNTDVTAAQTQGVTGRAWLEKYGFLTLGASGAPDPPLAGDPAQAR